jgi:hypothetical protein
VHRATNNKISEGGKGATSTARKRKQEPDMGGAARIYPEKSALVGRSRWTLKKLLLAFNCPRHGWTLSEEVFKFIYLPIEIFYA